MAFNTSIVPATSGTGDPDQIAFSHDVLFATHLGTMLRVFDAAGSVYRYAVIREVLTSRLCRVTWDGAALPLGASSLLWEEQAFSPARGYPRSVCIYQQRLCFGGAFQAGNLLLLSKSGQFRNFDQGVAKDADAIAVVGAGGVRTIRHLVEGEYLTIVTENGVSVMEVDQQKPVTPTTTRLKRIAPYGGGNAPPWAFDGGVLMVVDGGATVRDISYSSEAENTTAAPVSLAATGYLGTILDSAVLPGSNARPEQLAFFVNSTGRMVVFHSLREQKIGAWFEWTTFGTWTSVCVAGKIPYAVCFRDGSYRLERFDFDAPFDAQIAFAPQPPASPIPVAHLPAGVVAHAVDSAGDYLGYGEVVAGGVKVTRQMDEIGELGTGTGVVGMAFGWWIDPLPPAVDLPDGTMLERTLRVVSTALRLTDTQAAAIEGEALVLQRDPVAIGVAPPPASRWWRVKHLGWARPNGDGAMAVRRITRGVPLPVTCLGIKREVKV